MGPGKVQGSAAMSALFAVVEQEKAQFGSFAGREVTAGFLLSTGVEAQVTKILTSSPKTPEKKPRRGRSSTRAVRRKPATRGKTNRGKTRTASKRKGSITKTTPSATPSPVESAAKRARILPVKTKFKVPQPKKAVLEAPQPQKTVEGKLKEAITTVGKNLDQITEAEIHGVLDAVQCCSAASGLDGKKEDLYRTLLRALFDEKRDSFLVRVVKTDQWEQYQPLLAFLLSYRFKEALFNGGESFFHRPPFRLRLTHFLLQSALENFRNASHIEKGEEAFEKGQGTLIFLQQCAFSSSIRGVRSLVEEIKKGFSERGEKLFTRLLKATTPSGTELFNPFNLPKELLGYEKKVKVEKKEGKKKFTSLKPSSFQVMQEINEKLGEVRSTEEGTRQKGRFEWKKIDSSTGRMPSPEEKENPVIFGWGMLGIEVETLGWLRRGLGE